MMETLTVIPGLAGGLVFCLGLIFGSFFNVCIYRIPREESIALGGSRCRHCKKPIKWFDNIPLVSFLLLGAKCRQCKASVSIEYPLVELMTGAIFLLLYFRFGLGIRFLAYTIFASMLLVSSVIDLHHRIIPDAISLGGIPFGVASAWLTKDISLLSSVGGLLVGGGAFYAIAFAYEKTTKREGLGGGDIKLLGMIGAWLGIQAILPVIIISSFLGSIIGILYMLVQRSNLKAAIPFGPFLALAAMIFIWYGDELQTLLFASYQ